MIKTKKTLIPKNNYVTKAELKIEFDNFQTRFEKKIDKKLDDKFAQFTENISTEITGILVDSFEKIDKTLLEIKLLREDIKDHEIRIRRVEDKTEVIRISS